MDAVKFVEARRRMFAMTGEKPKYSLFNMGTPAEEVVREVEEWATAHPRKTRADEFLEHYPKASMGVAGVLDVPPCYIEPSLRSMCSEKVCADCRREFWMQEVE
jgi:hypothetical protein